MSYPEQYDVVERGVAKLLHQFQDKENIKDLISSYLEQLQDTEDLSNVVAVSRGIDDAIGRALDQIGAFVGEPRNSRNDSSYREAIKLRIIINNSNGTPDEVIQASQLLIPFPSTYQEVYPAKIRVEVDSPMPNGEHYDRLKKAVVAGVDLEIAYPSNTAGTSYYIAHSDLGLIVEVNPTDFYT